MRLIEKFLAGENGGLRHVVHTEDQPQPTPDGFTEITAEDYQARREQRDRAFSEAAAQTVARARERREAAGKALLDLGLSADHAAALCGIPAADLATT